MSSYGFEDYPITTTKKVEEPSFRINFVPENSEDLISILKLIKINKTNKGIKTSENNNIDLFNILDNYGKYTISLLLNKNRSPFLQILNYRIDYNGIDDSKTRYISYVEMVNVIENDEMVNIVKDLKKSKEILLTVERALIL